MGPILIIDDDRDVGEPLAELLEWEGFIPIPVSSGAAACKLIGTMAIPPAVILFDLGASTAFLDERARTPAVAAIPVVVLIPPGVTGAFPGADVVLPKPIDLAALVAAIERLATPTTATDSSG